MQKITPNKIKELQKIVYDYYQQNPRLLPWRFSDNPYHILVSEFMLQQTQVPRVLAKFSAFIKQFPTIQNLARASTTDVLQAWQGLGYNRRALALHKTAQIIVTAFAGKIPQAEEELITLPGIGPATAAEICAFAFQQPTVFIETNIRTVFIHHFFHDRDNIHDKELMPLIKQALDQNDPRTWYYALMDYGVYLKKQFPNPSRKSRSHTVQSKFQGSNRQIRGTILRLLLAHKSLSKKQLLTKLKKSSTRVDSILQALCNEGFIQQSGKTYTIRK